MSTQFFSTNNRRWFPVKVPPCREGSERMTIYRAIEASPGIHSATLLDRLAATTIIKPMRSRLAELHSGGYIRSELEGDLFNGA